MRIFKRNKSKQKYYKKQFEIIPDGEFYRPTFSPWHANGYGEFSKYLNIAKTTSVASQDRCYMLYSCAKQAASLEGHWYECGVYKGGTAGMLAALHEDNVLNQYSKLHLFDTFAGMPETDPDKDIHVAGDFNDTSIEFVSKHVKSFLSEKDRVEFHKGFIPETFQGLESHKISFAHIDVDIYKSIIDCCNFIYPRMLGGGFIVFDDYGFGSCPGARTAVDEFFHDKPEQVIALPTGQAIVLKVCDSD